MINTSAAAQARKYNTNPTRGWLDSERAVRKPLLISLALACIFSAWLVLGGQVAQAAIPGVNGKIVYTGFYGGSLNEDVLAINPDGTGLIQATNDPGADTNPSVSAAAFGPKVAFQSLRDGNNEIYIMSYDGTGLTRLTNNAVIDSNPAISPNGSTVAYENLTGPGSGFDIFTVNSSGGGTPTQLTDSPAADVLPAWSPDGTQIAFQTNRDGNDEIYVMDSDGSDETNITNVDFATDRAPNWSPDGTKIVYQTGDGDDEIFVMNANGSGRTRLTFSAGFDGNPVWSPDGTQIAFESDRSGTSDIYVMNAVAGAAATAVTASDVANSNPDWGPPWPEPPAPAPAPAPDTTAPVISSLSISPRRFAPSSEKTPVNAAARSRVKRRAKRGATISYTLSEAATVKLLFQKKGRGLKIKQRGKKRCVSNSRRNRRKLTGQIKRGFKNRKLSRKRLKREIRRAKCAFYRSKGNITRSGVAGVNTVPFSGRIGSRKLSRGSYRLKATATDASGNVSKAKRTTFKIVK